MNKTEILNEKIEYKIVPRKLQSVVSSVPKIVQFCYLNEDKLFMYIGQKICFPFACIGELEN